MSKASKKSKATKGNRRNPEGEEQGSDPTPEARRAAKEARDLMPRVRTGPQCSAHRTNGLPCKNPPIKGGTVCVRHGGAAKHVRAKANERLMEMVMPAMTRLRKIILNPNTSDADALRACREVLNRTGFTERFAVELEPSDAWSALLEASVMEDDRSLGGGTDTTPEIEAANMHQHAYDERERQWAPLVAEDRAAFEAGRVDNTGHRVVQAEPAEGWSPIPPSAVRPPETEHDRTPPGAGVQSREEMLMERLGEQDRDDRRRGWRPR